MNYSTELLIFIFVTLLSFFLWSRRKFYWLSWKLEGPYALPVLGNALIFRDVETIFENIVKTRELYQSPIRLWLGHHLFVYFDKPEHFEVILNSPSCLNKSDVYKFLKHFSGDGILVSEREKWSMHRKLLNPSMNQKVLLSFISIFNCEIDILVEKLESQIGKKDASFDGLIKRCVMDITFRTQMGTKLNTQNGKNESFLEAFRNAKEVIGIRFFKVWYHSDFLFRLSSWFNFQNNAKNIIDNFIENILIKKAMERKTKPYTDNSKYELEGFYSKSKHILVDQALNLMEDNVFNLENVEENLKVFALAAFDTTVVATNYIIFSLAAHPECQQKVINEVKSLFPEKNCPISFEETKNTIYMDLVINEVLRLFPPAPFIARKVIEDFQLTEGLIIPKDTQLFLDIFSMHRCYKLWGPNADKFDPDRFLPENLKNMHPYQFVPFSKGPRNCLGMKYSNMLLKIMLAKIFQNYRFTTTSKLEELKFRMDVSIQAIVEPVIQIHNI